MNAVLSRALTAGAFFLVIFGSGFWLSRAGKPYNGLLFNFHKLIALGALAFLAVTITRVGRAQSLQPGQIAAAGTAALCFVVMIVTGGLVSVEKTFPAFVPLAHRLFPYLTVVASGVALYFMR